MQEWGEKKENTAFLLQKCKKKLCFCSQKLDLRHFNRECHENLNIRTLRIKFRIKLGFKDSPQVVPAWTDWISHGFMISFLKLVWWNISQLKVLRDIWSKLVWYNISGFKVLWYIWFGLVWLNISLVKVLWDIWLKLVWLDISWLKVFFKIFYLKWSDWISHGHIWFWLVWFNISGLKVRCLTRIQYIVFVDVYAQNPISNGLRFHEILHNNCNISRLQISWDIIQ